MFKIDDRQIKEMEKDLKTFTKFALPIAQRTAMNNAAFATMSIAKSHVKRKMTNRNAWTVGSIQVDKATRQKDYATVGSTQDYMVDQELGGVKVAKGGGRLAIATSFSAGQKRAPNRTRLATKSNKLATIQLRKTKRGKNKKQTNIIKAQKAVRSGRRYIYMDFSGRGGAKGIFKIVGGRRSKRGGWPKGGRLHMVWDMSRKSVNIPKNPWLKPSVDRIIPHVPGMYKKALEFQMRRNGLRNWI